MKKIVIDAGGTSLKYRLLDDDYKLLREESLFGGSITNNCEEVKNNINEIFKKHEDISSGVFAFAGYNVASRQLKNTINEFLSKVENKIVISDSMLPTYFTEEDSVSMTLGTGSAIFKRSANIVKQYLGFGYAIGDIGSGYEIGRKILLKVLLSEDDKCINELKSILNTDENIVDFLWTNKEEIQKNIASISKAISSKNNTLRTIADSVLSEEMDIYINYVKKIVSNETLLLNGGIFSNVKYARDSIKKEFPNNKVILIKGDPLDIGVKILKERKW